MGVYYRVPKKLQNNLMKLKSERQEQIINLNSMLKRDINDLEREKIFIELNYLNDEIGLLDYVMLFGGKDL